MFHITRLKLTAWYLLILMSISFLFSAVIYNGINEELKRFEHMRVRVFEDINMGPGDDDIFTRRIGMPDPEEINKARIRLLTTLGLINLSIFGFAGAAGYFLAGRTLKPIEEMVERQKRFVSDASHEFRTPLTSLRSEIEVSLRDKKLTLQKSKEILKSNLEEVLNLQSLSEKLLLLAKNGDQKATNSAKINIKDVIGKAIKKTESLSKNKGIAVKNETKLPNIKVSEEFVEVFVILLDNAVKYSPKDSTIKIVSKMQGKRLSISISDQGKGIERKDWSKIFERFYRTSTSRSTSGFGLGLSIAKKIVENNNGTISVKSVSGKGSTFTVNIPQF